MGRVVVDVADYVAQQGLRLRWEDGADIAVHLEEGVVVRCNRAGLITLARHLLTLAQDDVPPGTHLHLDQLNGLAEGSEGIILEVGE